MLTKKDLELLLENFVTKSEFNHVIKKLEDKMVTREEFQQKFDLVMTTLDKVLKETIATRQEQAAHYQQHEDSNNEIKNIKKELKNWKTNN